MEKKIFYATPTQVKFRSEYDDEDQYGIAFENVVICGCCGGVSELDDVKILQELPWISLKDEIRGE